MDACPHVSAIHFNEIEPVLRDPSRWKCEECGTTESVWLCCQCGHCGCGRKQKHHALHHYHHNKRHHIVLDLNLNDEYVLNDNTRGEIKLSREILESLEIQETATSRTRSGRGFRKSQVILQLPSEGEHLMDDRLRSAIWRWKFRVLASAWTKWREVVQKRKKTLDFPPARPDLPTGRTGLRNLGNTCYVNSVLQCLAQIPRLRHFFTNLVPGEASGATTSHAGSGSGKDGRPSGFSPRVAAKQSPNMNQMSPHPPPPSLPRVPSTALSRFRRMARTTTEVCLHDVVSVPRPMPVRNMRKRGRDATPAPAQSTQTTQPSRTRVTRASAISSVFDDIDSVSLEMYRLFRVLWSGKWEVVTPHSLLSSLWKFVPLTRGYKQNDAQEFLDSMLDRLGEEVSTRPVNGNGNSSSSNDNEHPSIIHEILGGRTNSCVECSVCKNQSITVERSFGLAVDIQLQNQSQNQRSRSRSRSRICSGQSVSLIDCLEHFTAWENLEGYACDNCKDNTTARKRFSISRMPEVLELQLKRFNWTMYGPKKDMRHVSFPLVGLDIAPFCTQDVREEAGGHPILYDLIGLVEHHGKGWGGGHYTSCCRLMNKGTWWHYNDDRVAPIQPIDVAHKPAYLLFYARRDLYYEYSPMQSLQWIAMESSLHEDGSDGDGEDVDEMEKESSSSSSSVPASKLKKKRRKLA